MKKFTALIIMIGLAFLITGQAQAQWYVGGALAQAETDQATGFDVLPGSETDDSVDVAWKLLAGYHFSSGFAVEFGYSDLGDDYTTFNIFGINERTEMDVSVIHATLVGLSSVHDRVDFFGRLGLGLWDVKLDYSEPGYNSSGSDNDLDLVIGLGFICRVNDLLGVRFEWEQFQNIGDEVKTNLPLANRLQLNGQDINTMEIGLTYSF